jgi:drug/metabolite transporter (DMT)-like permease
MGAFTYLVPPLAVLLGWVVLSESPPALALAGGALCLAGVAITRRRRQLGAYVPKLQTLPSGSRQE